MIPAGHTPLGTADTAAAQGLTTAQWRRRGGHRQPGHPPPLNPHRKRRRLYSSHEVHAYTRGQPLPPQPGADHPDDLLDSAEARRLWGQLSESAWWARIRTGTAPGPVRRIYGEPYWRRHTLETARDHPGTLHGAGGPGRGGGRKPGQRPGPYRGPQQRRNTAAALLHQQPGITGAQLAAQLDVSTRTAERYLADLRTARTSSRECKNIGVTHLAGWGCSPTGERRSTSERDEHRHDPEDRRDERAGGPGPGAGRGE